MLLILTARMTAAFLIFLLYSHVLLPSARCDDKQTALVTEVFDVRNYGAKGDGRSDDTAAINATLSAVRRSISAGKPAATKIIFPPGQYRVSLTLNFTGIRDGQTVVEGAGAIILGTMVGSPIIDAFGTRFLRWRDLSIMTVEDGLPTVGMQIGQVDDTTVCDDIFMDNISITGDYSVAAFYNRNAETSTFIHPRFWNNHADAYAIIEDGYNVFGLTSQFLKTTRSGYTDTSFNENLFINGDFREFGVNGVALWMSDTARHQYIRSYAAVTNGSDGVVIYNGGGVSMLDMDLHIETVSLKHSILFSGVKNQKILGFKLRDHNPQASISVLAIDQSVESVDLLGMAVDLGFFSSPDAKFIDEPRRWTGSGLVFIGTGQGWNFRADRFSGIANIAGKIESSRIVDKPLLETGNSKSETAELIRPSRQMNEVFSDIPNELPFSVRSSLTGNEYIVPKTARLVRFTQNVTVARQLIILPSEAEDGDVIQFINYSRPVKAVMFRPAVDGWRNGKVLLAGVGVRIRWDGVDHTWHREQ